MPFLEALFQFASAHWACAVVLFLIASNKLLINFGCINLLQNTAMAESVWSDYFCIWRSYIAKQIAAKESVRLNVLQRIRFEQFQALTT